LTSCGSGGPDAINGEHMTTPKGTHYNIVTGVDAPSHPFLIVYSGTEGADQMMMNIAPGSDGPGIYAILDGPTYALDDGTAGADVIDDVRSKYNIDNDRMNLMGESAGTMAALQLGFHKRQSYFA